MKKPIPGKWLMLVVILALPGCVYLFLQVFGRSVFELPEFSETGAAVREDCGMSSVDFQVKALTCRGNEVVAFATETDYLLHFPGADSAALPHEINEMRRLASRKECFGYQLITLAHSAVLASWQQTAKAKGPLQKWEVTATCDDPAEEMIRCQLLIEQGGKAIMAAKSRLVLLDRLGRIRGYFNAADKKEIDRLIVEMEILKQEKWTQ